MSWAAAFFVLIWSSGFIAARFGMPHAPPMSFLIWRFGLSLLCFLVWARWARSSWPQQKSQWMHLGVVGILMQAGYLGGVWSASHWGMGAGLVALIAGLQPLLTASWVSSRGTQRIYARQWLGISLGFIGLVLVVLQKIQHSHEVNLLSFCSAVVALLTITAGTLYQKRFVRPCEIPTANAIQVFAALLVALPLAALESEVMDWAHPSLIGALAWSVLVLTLGGSSLLYLLIQRGTATSVTSLLYLVPPLTAFMAWLCFNEPIGPTTILGTVLSSIGVALVVRKRAAET